ncbi:MAG: hypothetical protein Q6366_017950 [Candidatus Freyarchaeota archaeon]
MKVDRLEQTAAIKLLLYLEERGEAKMGQIVQDHKGRASQSALYRAIPLLKDLKLVEEHLLAAPPRRIIKITEKGKQVAKKLKEINQTLEK